MSFVRSIALLRGINVGGNTMIKMAELKLSFESLGFENVVTYINSGNIAFDHKASRAKNALQLEHKLVEQLEAVIEKDFGKSVPVMVREQGQLITVFSNNPFDGEFENHKEMHVLFMRDEMPVEKQEQLLSQQTADERFIIAGREIYCHLKLGVADSLLGKSFIEKKLKTPITARNWRTVEKLGVL